jgi:hypothetical protein
MKPSSNRWWAFLGLPLSGLLLITALYVKKPAARDFIDHQFPWVKETMGRYAPPFEVRVVKVTPPAPAPVQATVPPERMSAFTSPPADPPPPPVAERAPSAPAVKPDAFDLEKVCADPARWPKTVHLKAPVDFPAVLEGKVVGKLRATGGTETRVVKVSDGKVGVEYHGGGAWLDFDRTDFIERARDHWQ